MSNELYFKDEDSQDIRTKKLNFLVGAVADSQGEDGVGISSFSFESTTDPSGQPGMSGATDTYVILLSDSSSYQFDVKNGVDGTNGINGTSITSVNSVKDGLVTTVTINGNFVNAPYTFDITDGLDGVGSGDMLSENNLSDVDDVDIARDNINAQEILVDDVNIKTINGKSILGSGDLLIEQHSIPNNGYIGNKPSFSFNEDVGFLYKTIISSKYFKINPYIVELVAGSLTIDLSDNGSFPFDVEVLDQTVNGLVCQNAKNSGDYAIVDKKELLINGSFDTNIDNWLEYNSTNSWNNSALSVTYPTTPAGAYQVFTTEVGRLYKAKVDVISATYFNDINFKLRCGNGDTPDAGIVDSPQITEPGTVVVYFVAQSTTSYIYLRAGYTVGVNTVVWDNPSVELAEGTYRCIVDTPSLTSLPIRSQGLGYLTHTDIANAIEVTAGTSYTFEVGKVYLFKNGFTSNMSNRYMKRLTSDTTITPTSTSTYIDYATYGNYWTEMSHFETRDYVSNQYLVMIDDLGIIQKEVLINDVDKTNYWKAPELNGWNKLENGLYSKGDSIATPIGIWQTLNNGAYHPVYNPFGTAKYRIENVGYYSWYQSSFPTTDSISDLMLLASGTGTGFTGGDYTSGQSGRPDNKYSDIVYEDQFIPLLHSAEYDDETVEESRNRLINNDKGVDCSIATYQGKNDSGTDGLISIRKDSLPLDWTKESIPLGTKIQTNRGFASYVNSYGAEDSTYIRLNMSTPIDVDGTEYVYIPILFPILSYGTKLSADVIGDPSNYPQDWKDVLVSSKPIVGLNPLLVGQDGSNYIPDNTLTYYTNSEKQIDDWLIYLTSDDSGISWGDATSIANTRFDAVGNNTFMTHAIGRIALLNYASKNPTLNLSEPLQIVSVDTQAVASNSHSIYKGNMLVEGDIQVGSGVGIESRSVENNILIDEFINPTHSIINLDNTSNGHKHLIAKAVDSDNMVYDVAITEELVWDYDKDTASEFVSILGSNTTFTEGDKYYISSGRFMGYYLECIANTSGLSLDDSRWVEHEGYIGFLDASNSYFSIWDGNGFGDNKEFNQLANGTLLDLNGNQIRTMFSAKPTLKFKKDK